MSLELYPPAGQRSVGAAPMSWPHRRPDAGVRNGFCWTAGIWCDWTGACWTTWA